MATSMWPRLWKIANINPIPKVDIPKIKKDFRGINITPIIARAFERIVYEHFSKDTFERELNNNQFAYRKGGSCVDALLKVRHFNLKALDNSWNKTVRLFAMDFSKAFDSVRHNILGEKLKATGLNPYLVNWYFDFLKDRKQRIMHNGIVCEWKMVNKGTTQGSVSGPHLFNLFVNDLIIEEENKTALDKYADDATLQVVVLKNSQDDSLTYLNQFMNWTEENYMSCNTSKCKELVVNKSGRAEQYIPPSIMNMEQCPKLKLLGVTFQSNCKFTEHVKNMLYSANKSLYVIRSLRKEGLCQRELNLLFNSLVISKILYGLSVYGSSTPDLYTVQCFLTRCFKRNYSSKHYDIYKLLERSDRNIWRKIKNNDNHPLKHMLPIVKDSSRRLRNKSSLWPKCNTERFKNSFFNRLIFKYNLHVDNE
ncbi:Hypothetical predicted protein [Paramuricea clavata]|uniref:Uncharacterized protein n=1 Tax=Paramuricea clavata TaxID=317549 RepID=A0A7D9I681_PARCT|nr:Hypothetical predicted protein [Paramuricea clavata]